MEQREALVDLLLGVRSGLREDPLEQEPEDHLALLALRRDPRQPAVDEVGPEHLVLIAGQPESGERVREGLALVRPVALGTEAPARRLRLDGGEAPAELPDAIQPGGEGARRVRALLGEARIDEGLQVAPDRRHRLTQLAGERLRARRTGREARDDPDAVPVDERPEPGEQPLVHAASLRSPAAPAPV